jgi:long-chain-fatty-acid--CoA ligase ACSBG
MAVVNHQPIPWSYYFANWLVFKRIKKALGLDRVRIFFYGAAPLRKTTVDYFASLDIPLLNCYGLTETTGG